uniref:Uncharacterized protein n=1 Tax=Bursaphelenchus xylophilus TaxID=6326 RepID=A0A1I7S7J4_BURXY
MAANSALDKKLRRAIGILEGNPPQRTGIPTPKRHKDPLVEACHEVRKVLVDEEYWPKTYTSRALSGLFDVLDKDDASLRILADQCLNGILRKFLTKGQTSRTLAILLNELGRKASARGFVAALTMLESTLRYAKEARLPVYAMHLLNSLKEAVKRPEQAVQSVVEQLFAPIFEYFKNDLNDSHYNYVDALAMQCLENLQLSGVSNRAASAVLAGIFENFPRIRAKIVYSLLDTLRSAEDINDKNRLVGAFNTFKKLWKNLESADVIHSILYRVLCSLRTQSSEIQTAGLELLDEAISSTSLEILKFQPASFTDSDNGRSSIPESLGNLSINEKDLSFDVDEGATMSRFNSVNSLEESVPPSARSEVSEEDVFNNASDDEDTNSGRTSKSGAEIETDPLFRRSSPSEYLLDNVEEPETQESPSHSAHEAIYGPLCAELPKTRLESTANFLDYTGYTILSKFLFTGTPGELKSDSEVRVSIKVLALKVLAAISAVYYKINELVIGQQHFSDIQILIQNSDDAVSVRCFEVLTNLETEMIRKGTKIWPITPPTKFSMHLSQLTRQPNPMKLKELFQVLNKAHLLLQADQNTLKSVLNLAIDTFECDYFLLKVVRAEFLAHIKWDLINPATREAYQRKCFQLLMKSLFDSDYRVASAVSELLPVAVKNAEFSQLSNTFNCQWPEEMAAPSFAYQPQVFALHPNYSFRGDCPDLVLEHSLTTTIAMLYEEVSTRNSDFSHFVLGLLKLAEQFSPCVYGQAWACPDNKSQRSVLDIVLEQTDGFTTNPSDFINALRLISLIFCGLMENSLSQYANQPKEKDFLQGNAILDQVITVYLRVLNLYFTVIRENTTKLSSTMNSPLFTKRNWVQGGVNSSAYENRSIKILAKFFIKNLQILSLLGVLVTNDVRYDKLDPQSRIWKSVLQFIRHPTLKYVEELKNLFTFVCLATRVIDVSFDEVIILMGKCLEKLEKTNADDILDALHVVLLEAVGYYVKVPQTLIDLLKQENTSLFSISPAKTIQLWTLILHWARTTQPDLFYQDLSTNFVHELGLFIDKSGFKTFKNRKMAFEIGNSIIIGLKTCHPNTFKPINNIAEMLIKSLDVGWTESLPFISFLLCRIDLDIVLVQLKDIIDEPVEKLSR